MLNWYAVKVFWNRTALLTAYLDGIGVGYYTQKVIPTLVFIHCEESFAELLRREQYGKLYVYSDRTTHKLCAIPEEQMAVFRLVTSSDEQGLEFLGDDLPKYHEGEAVRVIAGPFKGAVGHVKRIKKDRRLVITIDGVCAVATSFIHPSLLERVDEEPETK